MNKSKEYSSFRDPSGFVFEKDKDLYRQINYSYRNNYDFFIQSGLYQDLVAKKYIIPFQEIEQEQKDFFKIIKPQRIDFITYPYEWCFSQYKDAALLVLKIQKEALLKGMTLKDASAYNIQFQENNPIHIDTLSFEKLIAQKPWRAYMQFCQHFLAPLALMSYVNPNLNNMMRNYIDGIPLSLASKLLPKFKNWGIFVHIHLNAFFSDKNKSAIKSQDTIQNMTLNKHLILIDSLYHTVENLKLSDTETEWEKYYENTNYSNDAFKAKEDIILKIVSQMPKNSVLWDLGANDGHFTRLATKKGLKGISFDIDINAVEKNYKQCRKNKEAYPLPLILDLTNPSPGIGWNNNERTALFHRAKPDIIMGLALIHHLVISNNIPFEYIADTFSQSAPKLIIEFVAKEDSQVQKMLSTREDIWPNYTEKDFEAEFLKYYTSLKKYPIPNTKRTIYFFEK